MYTKDESKPYQYDWENLKVGDFVFDILDADGFCIRRWAWVDLWFW